MGGIQAKGFWLYWDGGCGGNKKRESEREGETVRAMAGLGKTKFLL